MKKLNNKGFSAVEAILILVIVAAIGGVGYYVWNQNQESKKTAEDTAGVESTPGGKKSFTYTIPEGFTEKNCDGTNDIHRVLSHSSDPAKDCNDVQNVILADKSAGSTYVEGCLTEEQLAEYKKTKPLTDYKCEKTKIGAYSPVKESGDWGGGLMTSYRFNNGDESLFLKYYADKDGKYNHMEEFEAIVESVK